MCRTEPKNKGISEAENLKIKNFTLLETSRRFEKIQEWVNDSRTGQDPVLKEFNIFVDKKAPLEVNGRVIPAPDIEYGYESKINSEQIKLGYWNHDGVKFYKSVSIKKWIIIDLCRREFDSTCLEEKLIDSNRNKLTNYTKM